MKKAFRVDLDSINRDDFYVNQDDQEEIFLIKPRRSKHVWDDDELKYRSLVVDKDGFVISAGFPKFFNFGEREKDSLILTSSNLTLFEKRDGTLIIVDKNPDGSLWFRTRGSLDLGDFHDPVMDLVKTQNLKIHPIVFDGSSTLFEYTAPDNQIVLSYDQPELTLLGWTSHEDVSTMSDPGFLVEAASVCGCSAPETYDVDDPFVFRKLENLEGVVAVCQNTNRRLKIKSEWYVKMHRIRTNFTDKQLFSIIRESVPTNKEVLRKALYAKGFDAECFMEIEEQVNDLFSKKNVALGRFQKFYRKVRNNVFASRKDGVEFIRSCDPSSHLFNVGICALDGRYDRLLFTAWDYVLEQEKKNA